MDSPYLLSNGNVYLRIFVGLCFCTCDDRQYLNIHRVYLGVCFTSGRNRCNRICANFKHLIIFHDPVKWQSLVNTAMNLRLP